MILKIKNEQGQFIDIPAIKGAKGNAFKFEDFTPEQLEALRGPAGADGKTPVRGIDYYTDEDIAYIINEVGTKINLDEYLTIAAAGETYLAKADAYTRAEIDDLIKNVKVDLSDYYTKEETDDAIANAITGGTVDLKDYLKKKEAEDTYAKKNDLPDTSNFVEKTITNVDGTKALIFNETDGGGAKFEGIQTNSYVGVNNGTNNVDTIIYAINKDSNEGSRLIGNTEGMYYTKGNNLDVTANDELLTKKDLSSIVNGEGFQPYVDGSNVWELADAAYKISGNDMNIRYDNFNDTVVNNGGYLYITSDETYKYYILIKNKETFFNIEYGRVLLDTHEGTHNIFSTQTLIDLNQVVDSTTLEIIE